MALPIGSFNKPRNPGSYMTPGIKLFPTSHPLVKNKDGSVSNVVIFGYQEKPKGPIYAIPSMVGGVQLPENEAIKVAKSHGLENYPKHPTPEQHNKWAEQMHGRVSEKGILMDEKPDVSISNLLKLFKSK